MGNPLKKTMVFLGLAEEDLDAQDTGVLTESASAPAAPARPAAPRAAQVTPLRKVTPTRASANLGMSEILTVHPTAYADAPAIAESFREGTPVILNLSRMNDGEARQLIDFSSGLVQGLNGRIDRVTARVFLLTPEHIAVNGDLHTAQHEGDSFFVSASA